MLTLFVIFLCMFVVFLFLSRDKREHDTYWDKEPWITFTVIVGILLIILGGVMLGHYFSSLHTKGEIIAFYNGSHQSYQQAIQDAVSKAVVTKHLPKSISPEEIQIEVKELLKLVSGIGDKELVNLDNFQISKDIVYLIREYRDIIWEYNKDLARMRLYKGTFLLGQITPEPPDIDFLQ